MLVVIDCTTGTGTDEHDVYTDDELGGVNEPDEVDDDDEDEDEHDVVDEPFKRFFSI